MVGYTYKSVLTYFLYTFRTVCRTVCDCHLWSSLCYEFFSPFFHLFTHTHRSSCVCNTWLRYRLAFKQMYTDSTWRGPAIWASEPRMSLVLGIRLLSFLSFFPPWSIYHKLCKLSQWDDRRPVQAFFWKRQEAHCCSGHVCWSTALQYTAATHCKPPLPYTILPPCEEPYLIHSPPNCFFSPCSCSWKARMQDFIWCFLEVSPILVWHGKPSRSTISNTFYQTEVDFSANSSALCHRPLTVHKVKFYVQCLGSSIFCVWKIHIY